MRIQKVSATLFSIAVGISILGRSGASAQSPPEDQCSVAVVSRFVRSDGPVCDMTKVQSLAQSGHAFEQNQLGIASMLVVAPELDAKEALAWFERAAQRGYPPAEVNLAVMYINGWGTPVNYAGALKWLNTAADQHFPRAYTNLGILYLEGKGVRQDYSEAFRWFQKGAEAGDSSAQTNLGYMYDQGLGRPNDVATAAKWYRKAAEAGNPLGENNLADLYLRGEGLKQNDSAAFFWFRQAALQGHTGARIKLGYMYAEGRGAAKDPTTAYTWIKAAQMAGDPRGDEMLHRIEKVLSAEEVTFAREHATKLQHADANLSAKNFAQ